MAIRYEPAGRAYARRDRAGGASTLATLVRADPRLREPIDSFMPPAGYGAKPA